jgi:alpha-galactosidase
VYDLWANRMSETEAAAILNGTIGDIPANSTTRFNATQMSYMDGVKSGHAALMGKQVGTLLPSGTFSAEIARHSVGVYRFRSRGSGSKDKDEL